jgi:hypothetical protein
MKCSQCQAEVKLAPGAAEADCPYCGATVSRPAPRSADPLGALFADENGNGIPDFVEGLGVPVRGAGAKVTVSRSVSQRFVVNGVTYDSLEAMPPEARRIFEGLSRAAATPLVTSSGAVKLQVAAAGRSAGPRLVALLVAGLAAAAGLLCWLLAR